MDSAADTNAVLKMQGTGETWLHALPEDLRDWMTGRETLASALSHAFSAKANKPVSENTLWDLIAGDASPDWTAARATLKAAERTLHRLNAPENMPLGPIGAALHSDETNAAEHQHRLALADFTIVNETLRQQEPLHRLLRAALAHHETLSGSQELSRRTSALTQSFGDATAENFGDTTAENFGNTKMPVAKTPAQPLAAVFRGLAQKLLRRPAAPKAKAPGVSA